MDGRERWKQRRAKMVAAAAVDKAEKIATDLETTKTDLAVAKADLQQTKLTVSKLPVK